MTVAEFERLVEDMVDKGGMQGMLTALVAICHGKADHLRSNWQDEASARHWEQAAKVLDKAIAKMP